MNRQPRSLRRIVSKFGIFLVLPTLFLVFVLNISHARNGALSSTPPKGTGTFGTAIPATSDTQPSSVAIGDFNGDGKPDLVVTNSGAGNVSILQSLGGGTFKAPVKLATGTSPRSVAAGDFNKDGKLDFAVANFGNSSDTSTNGTVWVFINNGNDSGGNPTFNSPSTYTVGVHPRAIIAVPLFGPGSNVDLITANADSGNISVLEGNGNGTFFTIFGNSLNFNASNPNAASSHPIGLAAGDFNGDGRLDIAVADRDGNSVNLLIRPNADGSLQFNQPLPISTGNNGAFWVATDDFNGDGKLDIAVANVFPDSNNKSQISVILNSGNTGTTPGFSTPVLYSTGTNTTPQSIASADLNGDGKSDLVIANFAGNASVLLNKGDGTFLTPVGYAAGTGPEYVAIGDLNLDGIPDLVVADQSASSTSVDVLLGNSQPGLTRSSGKIALQRGFGATLDDPYNRGGKLYKTDPSVAVNQTTGAGENAALFGDGSQPSYSSDGSKIAFLNSAHLFITDAGDYSTAKGLVVPQGGSPITASYPNLSPDNSQVAYQGLASVSGNLVYKITVVNSACIAGNDFNTALCNSTVLAFGTSDTSNNMYPAWYPALSLVGGGNRAGRIIYVRTASKGATTGDIFSTDVLIAPNGKLTETATRNLTNSPANYSYIAYSPDGSFISYTKDGTLWLMNADGTNNLQIQHSSSSGTGLLSGNRVSWAPDESKIAFDFNGQIWTADISLNSTAASVASNVSFLSLSQADGDEFASWEPGPIAAPTPSPSPSPSPTPNASITFEGRLRDRVGRSDAGISPDGDSDGTFTLTLPVGSASRVITGLDLQGQNGNRWDTVPNNALWVIGIADSLDKPLLNSADGSINFQAGNGTFKLFVPDSNPSSFVQGKTFSLTVKFGDGSSYQALTTATQTPFVDLGLGLLGPQSQTASTNDIIRYGASIQNFGTQVAGNVLFTLPIPTRAKLVSVEPTDLCDQTGVSTLGPTVKCNFGSLPAGAGKSVVINIQDTTAETIHMNASVTSDHAEVSPDPHSNSASVTTDISKPTDVSVSVVAPAQANTTDDITYELKVTNNTTGADAHSVVLTDALPTGTSFVSVTPPASVSCNQNGGGVTCNIPTVESKATYGINLKVHPTQAGTITNSASVTSATIDPNLLNNTASASTNVLIGSDVSVTMSAPAQVGDNENLTYAIRVKNNGPANASQVVVGDQLPSNVTFVSVSPGPQANAPKCDLNLLPKAVGDPDAVQCAMGAMPNGTTFQINLTVKPKSQSGNISNTVVAFPVFENVSDAIPSNNTATTNTVACISGNSAVPTFQTGSSTVTSVGQAYVYNVRATDPRGAHVGYTLGQGPTGMTLTSLSDGSARVEWTPPAQLSGQSTPVKIVASNGSCNGTVNQSFSLNVTEPPPPGGYKLAVGNVTFSSSSMVKISNTSFNKKGKVVNATDPLDGTYKLGGDTKINNYLHFEGDITVAVSKANATFSVVVSQGKLEITNIPFYGSYTLWQGGGLSFFLDGNGQITNFLQTNVQKPLNVAGINVAIDSARLVLQNDLGIVLTGKLVFDNVAGIKNFSVQFSELSITQQTGIRFSSDIVIPEFKIGGGFSVKQVQLKWIAGATPAQDIFRGGGKLVTPAFEVAGSVEFIAGTLNSVTAAVSTDGPGLPVPPFFNITGASIGVQNIRTGPFTIFIKCNVTLVDPAVAKIIKLTNAGITYTAPGKLDISSDLDIFSTRAANAILGVDLPRSFKIGAGVTLVDDFQVFIANAQLAAGLKDDGKGTPDDPTGHLTFTIEGSADATIQIPDESDFTRNFSWVYHLLKANPGPNVHFPVPVAKASVAFGYPQGRFSYSTSLPIIGEVTATVARVESGVLAQVASNYGNMPVTIPIGARAVNGAPTSLVNSRTKQAVQTTTDGVYVTATNDAVPQALGSVLVTIGTPKTIFQVTASGGAARYDLIKPDSTRITPENAASNNAVFVQNLDTADSFYVVTTPDVGVWNVEAEDGQTGPFVLSVHGGNAAPVISSVSASPAGSSVQITYNATDADDDAKVSLYYDTNPAGFQGSMITSGLPKGGGSFVWNAQDGSVPSGDYYVYALIDDGMNVPQRKYAETKITVVDPTAPATPQGVVVSGTGENSLVVSWTPNTEPNLRGYIVKYGVDQGDGTVLSQSFETGVNTTLRIPKLANFTAYRVSVTAYNQTEKPDPNDSTKTIITNKSSSPSAAQTATTGVGVPPLVTITAPNGGETMPSDNDLNISWTVDQDGDIASQTVEVSFDGGLTYNPLQLSLDSQTRNFLWHVPSSIQTSTALVRITATDTSGNAGMDVSDAVFAISAAPTPTPTPSASPSPSPTPATMALSSATFSAPESQGSVTLTVNRSGDTSAASTVDYLTADGTAHQSTDYELSAGTISFAAGESQKTITVLVNTDYYIESDETFTVTLSNPVNGNIGAQNSATVTITDSSAAARTQNSKTFIADLNKAQVVPQTPSTAHGAAVVQLNSDETSAHVSLTMLSPLTGTETTATINGPADPGASGPVLFTLPTGNFLDFNIAVTPTGATQLKNGQLYMNITSSAFANGEIRGQLLANTMDDEASFVRQHYYDFMSRVPDSGGFDYWTGQLNAVGTDPVGLARRRIDVSDAFFFEPEYQQTAAYVYRLHRIAFGNNQPLSNPDTTNVTEAKKLPSYAAFTADRTRVIGGVDLAAGQTALANEVILRPEFVARYPLSLVGPDFVDAVLATVRNDLGIELSSQRAALLDLYTTSGRAAVLYRLADDNVQTNPINNRALIDAEYNRAFIVTQYFGYLRRDADINGFLFWLGQINKVPVRDVPQQHAIVCSFITSAEYQLRFSPVVSRSNTECPQ